MAPNSTKVRPRTNFEDLPESPLAPTPVAQDPRTSGLPHPLRDLIDAIKANSNIASNSGSPYTLDVIPDHRFPLISWLHSVRKGIPRAYYSGSPGASPASLIGYTYAIYIALLYLNDVYLRPTPSRYASDVKESKYSTFFDKFKDLPVPPFAEMDFEALRFFSPDIASNLATIGSAAGFSFQHDFGRFFTTYTFFGLDDLLACEANGYPLFSAQAMFPRMPVAEIELSNTRTLKLTPSHLFGLIQDDISYSNWLNVRLTSILSFDEAMANRSNARPPPISATPKISVDDINPYLFMMSISDDNIASLQRRMTALSSFTLKAFPAAKTLRSFLRPGSAEPLRHLIFELPPPTWHSLDIEAKIRSGEATGTSDPFLEAAKTGSSFSHTAFARELNFRTAEHRTRPVTDGPGTLQAAALITPTDSWQPNLVVAGPSPEKPEPGAQFRFTLERPPSTTPDTVIFEPTASSEPAADQVHVITSGKLIEIGDISSIVMPVPNPRRLALNENTHYSLGSIPAHLIRHATAMTPTNIRYVDDEDLKPPPFGFTLGSIDRLTHPVFRPGAIFPATNPRNIANASALVPGAVSVPNSSNAFASTNVFLSPTPNGYNIPDQSVTFWSSYRHYDTETETWLWLPTLRHIFGTQTRTAQTIHPSRSIRTD